MSTTFPALSPATTSDAPLLAGGDPHTRLAWQLALTSVVCLLLAFAALAVDLPIAQALIGPAGPIWDEVRGTITEVVCSAEALGHGVGAIVILLIILLVDPASRRTWPRMLTLVLAAGFSANFFKAMIVRTRPHCFVDPPTMTFKRDIYESFQGLQAFHGEGYSAQSMPSGHTTTAVVMAIILSQRWPRARWVFAAIAVGAVMQRLCASSHYLSDCFAGAALGCLVAAVIYHPRLVGRFFDWWEQRCVASGSSMERDEVADASPSSNAIRRAA